MRHALQSNPATRRAGRAAEAITEPPPSDDPQPSLMSLTALVEPNQLSVVYQPLVDFRQRTVFAYEAFVRCSAAELENPLALFEQAAARGCTGSLGRLIRELAVAGAEGCRLFLNVHPKELDEPWLVRLDDPIFTHDDEIYLEVSESVPMSHGELCRNVLVEVASRGAVHLAVDDLGAGPSNLLHIAELHPRVVKLDRQLVMNLDANPRKLQLVGAIADLCARLGAQVVAEGVETVDELHALLTTGVRYGQGYLFAKPGSPLPDVAWPS